MLELKRGSLYQSSENVKKMQQMGLLEEKKQVKTCDKNDIFISFSVIDSLSQPIKSERYSPDGRQLKMSFYPFPDIISVSSNDVLPSSNLMDVSSIQYGDECRTDDLMLRHSSNGFLEISFDSEWDQMSYSVKSPAAPLEKSKLACSDSITLLTPNMPAGDLDETKQSRISCFSPLGKILSPKRKTRSQYSSPDRANKSDNQFINRTSTGAGTARGLDKCVFDNFLKNSPKIVTDMIWTETRSNVAADSFPVQLHGILEIEIKQGLPVFEFFVREHEELLSAKAWRTTKEYNWVYSFAKSTRRKRENYGHGKKYGQLSTMIGQMQVSRYPGIRYEVLSENSTIMEFVSYDFTHASKEIGAGSKSSFPCELNVFPSHPCARVDLHPPLEVAAIMIQIPDETGRHLKPKGDSEIGAKGNEGPLSNSFPFTNRSPRKVRVLTSSGSHGLPSTGQGGPCPLLDRWRSGGECDCGGWDMGCPILILESPDVENLMGSPALDSHKALELYLQGKKETVPTLSIGTIGKERYAVNFHARLSSLQALSIAVAFMHSHKMLTGSLEEDNRKKLNYKSFDDLLSEEGRSLIKVMMEDGKKDGKAVEDILATFALEPPFSPIGRV